MTAPDAALSDAIARRAECLHRWGIAVERSAEPESSLIDYGRRGPRAVVLKVVKKPGDEWRSGAVVRAFDGRGMVEAIEYEDGAVLLDRLDPGTSLAELSLSERDDEATAILAQLLGSMNPGAAPTWCPTVADWARSFARYRESGDAQLAAELVLDAERVYLELCATQKATRLLHGDLQHYNVLYDRERGWTSIDPKGVVGELEYELGAAMRNPAERPSMFTDPRVVRRRLGSLCATLGLDLQRAIAWTYAQAVLSAIWGVEDGYQVDATTPVLVLARAMRPSFSSLRISEG